MSFHCLLDDDKVVIKRALVNQYANDSIIHRDYVEQLCNFVPGTPRYNNVFDEFTRLVDNMNVTTNLVLRIEEAGLDQSFPLNKNERDCLYKALEAYVSQNEVKRGSCEWVTAVSLKKQLD
jgi:hypothetical protein